MYSHGFATYIAERGHEVEVITGVPYYPGWKKFPGYRNKLYQCEIIDGVRVHRCYTYVPKVVTSFRRILHEAVFAVLAFGRMIFMRQPDLLIAVSPPFSGMVACAVLSRLRGIPLHIHIQDLQPDAAIELGMLRGKLLVHLLRAMERFSYRNASLVSAIGDAMLQRIREKGVPSSKSMLFRNWINLSEIKSGREKESVFRTQHRLDGKFLVLYSGSMGEKQGLFTLVECAALAHERNDDMVFLMVGDGAHRLRLENKARSLGLPNILFFDVQPRETFEDLLATADVSVLLQRKEVKEIVVPSKLLNILAAGSPVVVAAHPGSETATILNNLSIDIVVEPENPGALYDRICYLRHDTNVRNLLRTEEKALAEKLFQKDEILSRVVDQLEKLVSERKNF